MEVSLPDAFKEWVEAQARSGRYTSTSEYVGDLIRLDQERARKLSEFQQLVTEGLESGISTRSMIDLVEEARAQVNALRQR